jgi:CheY-like chemotaxis protein
VGSALQASQHVLTIDLPEDDVPLQGDATRLSQVFQNLLDNAVKYTPPAGHIQLAASRQGSEVAITVRDSGVGIPSDMQARVFEMFTRVNPDARIKTSGLGIGLSLARQLVSLHGGRIELASEGAGKGSAFTVYLPIQPAEVVAPDSGQPAASPAAAGPQRVLIVDDNRDAAESLAMILSLDGCMATATFSGEDALEKLPDFKPHVVLMDIGMPGMDGYETAKRMRATPAGKSVMLVALTGWGQAEDKKKAATMGFDEHLTKPVDPALLATVLSMRRAHTSDLLAG